MAGGNKKYHVTLTVEERSDLQRLLSSGRHAAQKLQRVRVLLLCDIGPEGPGKKDEEVHDATGAAISTIERIRKTFVEDGLEAAYTRKPSTRQYERRLDGDGEAHLIAIACSEAPEGYDRWSLQLMADKLVELGVVDSISTNTVQRTLKKTKLSPG